MTIGERIKQEMKSRGISQNKLAKAAQLSQSGLSSIISGAVSPKENTLQAIATALEMPVSVLVGGSKDSFIPGLLPVTPRAVPILGDIACGVPIIAEQNIEGYADLPEGVRADFALRCKGDSMEPTFLDGDLVLIRQEGDVSDGRIAAVLLDAETNTEATLKRVHHVPGGLILIPDNQKKYGPRTFQGSEAAKIRILGVAVGYVRMI